MKSVASTSFAKIFQIDDDRQVAIYVDRFSESPCLVLLANSSGVRSNSALGLSENEASKEVNLMALEKMLELIDESQARKIADALQSTINNHLPEVEAIHFVDTMINGHKPSTFAKFHGEGDEAAMVISDTQEDMPVITIVTGKSKSTMNFYTADERDQLFGNHEQLDVVLAGLLETHTRKPPKP